VYTAVKSALGRQLRAPATGSRRAAERTVAGSASQLATRGDEENHRDGPRHRRNPTGFERQKTVIEIGLGGTQQGCFFILLFGDNFAYSSANQLAFLYLALLLFMTTQLIRGRAVRPVLPTLPLVVPTPCEQELQLLTNYTLGHISLEEANDILAGQGRIMVALYKSQLVEA